MTPIQLAKHLILLALRPLEKRGIQFSMRRKLLDERTVWEIGQRMEHSFCPFNHFDTVHRAIEYLNQNQIQGDIVLCGVAAGGMAKFMVDRSWACSSNTYRKVFLYDMFDGGTLPGKHDSEFDRSIGEYVKHKMAVDFFEVARYVGGEPVARWVGGDVLDTIPRIAPEKIALLYLDTDWHDSTAHELKHLEPRVSKGGVIIQDDMGLCVGAAKAVNDYYAERVKPLMIPMDEAGFVWVKQ